LPAAEGHAKTATGVQLSISGYTVAYHLWARRWRRRRCRRNASVSKPFIARFISSPRALD
jgi:hypothetical protein